MIVSPPPSPVEHTGRRPLNAADRFLLVLDRALRDLGGNGFDTQTFLWLGGRIEPGRLRRALATLSRRYTGLCARLVEEDPEGGTYWRFRPEEVCSLHEFVLPESGPQAVLDHASRLQAAPNDPTIVDPMRFHLLHGPDGRDVLLVQYNHALLDHADAVLLLRQLERLIGNDECELDATLFTARDPVWAHLRKVPRERRRQASTWSEAWRRTLRGGAVSLGRPQTAGIPVTFGLVTGCLEAEPVRKLSAQVVQSAGVPCLSLAVLASVYRTIARLAGPGATGRYFNTGLGVDLGLCRTAGPALQNLTTLVPLRLNRDEMGERDVITRLLNGRLRDQLAHDMDLGVLRLATCFGRRQRQGRWSMELLARYCQSLHYGFFSPPRGLRPTFAGVPVEQFYSAGSAWPPSGLTLIVNQFQGRMHFQVTHVPECVSPSLAQEFLDGVLADLAVGPGDASCAG